MEKSICANQVLDSINCFGYFECLLGHGDVLLFPLRENTKIRDVLDAFGFDTVVDLMSSLETLFELPKQCLSKTTGTLRTVDDLVQLICAMPANSFVESVRVEEESHEVFSRICGESPTFTSDIQLCSLLMSDGGRRILRSAIKHYPRSFYDFLKFCGAKAAPSDSLFLKKMRTLSNIIEGRSLKELCDWIGEIGSYRSQDSLNGPIV